MSILLLRTARSGSPAWAGIDPYHHVAQPRLIGFPRVGGDRPMSATERAMAAVVPPRGRG